MDRLQNLRDSGVDFILAHMLDSQRIGHIIKHIHMGPYRVGLEYHSDIPLFRRNKSFATGDEPVTDPDLTCGGRLKTGYHAQYRGFAAARRAQKRYKFPVTENLIEFFQYQAGTEALCQVFYDNFRHILSFPFRCHCQIENCPFVRRFSTKFSRTTIIRMPNAMAQAMGWLVNVQYS